MHLTLCRRVPHPCILTGEMFILLVTGGLGSGKTTAAKYFASRGAVRLDLDEIGHRMLEPGTATHDRVVEEFGEGILDADGRIDRRKLAEAAFADRECATRLNAIIHPAVFRDVGPGLTDMGLLPNPPPVVVLEVPLLVEAPQFIEFADLTLAIVAPEDQRIAREVAGGMDEADARARVACQARDEERIKIADHVVVNASDLEAFEAELDRFWTQVVGR